MPAETYVLRSDSSQASEQAVEVTPDSTSSSSPVSLVAPLAIPSDQAYYWSGLWQTGVRESLEALEAGDFVEFDSDDPNDVMRWLFSADE